MTEAGPGAPAAPEMGVVQKLVGVFFSPAKTFEAVARKPGWDWLLPVVLLMVGVVAFQQVAMKKIDVDEAVAAQMKFVDRMQRNLPADKRAEVEEQTRTSFEKQKESGGSPWSAIVVLIPLLVVSGIYHGIATVSGKGTAFKTVLAGYAWVQCVSLLALGLAIAVAVPQTSMSLADVQFGRVLKSNVAAFLDFESTHKSLLGLLSSVDVFDLWYFVVNSIALSKTTRFSAKQAYAVVGTVWGVYIVIKVILGAVYSSMMG